MRALGYAKLAYVPFLISSDGSYPVEANRYLRERANLEWRPKVSGSDSRLRFNTRPTIKSLDAMARRIMEFLLWCQSFSPALDWRKVNYMDDLLGVWQESLLLGKGSRSGRKLSHATINARLSEACLFLGWAAERGYRDKFDVQLKAIKVDYSTGSGSKSHKRFQGVARVGGLAERPARIELPSDSELLVWMRDLRIRHGQVMGLIAESIMRTGMRISEANQLQDSDFPEKKSGPRGNEWPEEWLLAGEVPVTIKMGIKGPKISAGSMESIRPRQIYFPIDLADRIDHYRREGRTTLISRWVLSAKDKNERARRVKLASSKRMWLGKRGLPVSNSWIGQVWSSVSSCPSNWSPHRARSYFAVVTIVNYMRDVIEQHKLSSLPQVGWLHGLMAGQIKIILSPLLGHVDEQTSLVYLATARRRLVREFGHPALNWLEASELED